MSENIKEEFKVDALKQISNSSLKSEAPVINVGDTVKVHVRITEGDKSRIQVFAVSYTHLTLPTSDLV